MDDTQTKAEALKTQQTLVQKNVNPLTEIRDNDDFSDIEPVKSRSSNLHSVTSSQGYNYSNVDDPEITVLSDTEIGYKLWSFKISSSTISLTGMYHDGLLKRINELGVYRKTRSNSDSYMFVQETDNVLEQTDVGFIKTLIKNDIEAKDSELVFHFRGIKVQVTRDKLVEMYLKFAPGKLEDRFLVMLPLHEKPLLRDTRDYSYFAFRNCVYRICKDTVETIAYKALDNMCIWKDHIIDRELHYSNNGEQAQFFKFLQNVTGHDKERLLAFRSAIGYLMNNHGVPTETQAIIAYDEEITDVKNPMGGTGKGVFAKSISQTRKVDQIDGKRFYPSDRFKFQDINESTQVVWVDDISSVVGFETFHSCLTEGWHIEKKHKDSYSIPAELSPKLLITSNIIMQGSGTTNKRRQFLLEFSNHYSLKIKKGIEKPIESEHGGIFFDDKDWDAAEWNKFYSLMLDCCRFYHNSGLVTYEHKSIHLNILKQGTSEEFFNWVHRQSLEASKQYETNKYYSDFLEYSYQSESAFTNRRFFDFLKKYATSRNLSCSSERRNGTQYFIFNNQ
jgi:hypothetical protein